MKILVIQQKMIGDVLTSSILFEALREKYPSAELHYLIYEHTKPVVENNPFIDKLILFSAEKNKQIPSFLNFLKEIRNEAYDVVIDVYAKINSAIITYASGAKIRVSYQKAYSKFAYTHTYRQKKKLDTNAGYAVENRMLLLDALYKDYPLEIQPKIYLTASEKENAQQYLTSSGVNLQKPLIMVGVLGSAENKTYPLPFLAKILDETVAQTGAQLLFNYIPKQKKEAQQLLELCKPDTQQKIFFDVFGKSLREFMAITWHCDALVGNEGGAVNMAKAINIPTFSIFSPWIIKEAWALYENDLNVAVHLKDYQPKLIEKENNPKKMAAMLYQEFKPELFLGKYQDFLKRI